MAAASAAVARRPYPNTHGRRFSSLAQGIAAANTDMPTDPELRSFCISAVA